MSLILRAGYPWTHLKVGEAVRGGVRPHDGRNGRLNHFGDLGPHVDHAKPGRIAEEQRAARVSRCLANCPRSLVRPCFRTSTDT